MQRAAAKLVAARLPVIICGGGVVLAGASEIIFHPGSYFEHAPEEVLPLAVERLRGCVEELRAAVEADKPMLGICRGLQVMNVALGGTLYTHIPDQLPNVRSRVLPAVPACRGACFTAPKPVAARFRCLVSRHERIGPGRRCGK